MNDPIVLKIELPKVPDIELVAVEGLNRLAHHLGIQEGKVGEARILITESIINALEHGTEGNAHVVVQFTMTTGELVIDVQDSGKGFEPSAVEEPDIEDKLHSSNKRGWGLKLMKSISDDFQIASGQTGTRIIIKKLLR